MRFASVSGHPSLSRRNLPPSAFALTLPPLCTTCSLGGEPVNPLRGKLLMNAQPAIEAQALSPPAECDQG